MDNIVDIKDIVKKILEVSKSESEKYYTESTNKEIDNKIGAGKSYKYKKLYRDCIDNYVLMSGIVENFYSYDVLKDYVTSLILENGTAAPVFDAANPNPTAAANFEANDKFNINRLYAIYISINTNLKDIYDINLTNKKYKEIFLANELTRLFFNANVETNRYIGLYKDFNLETLNNGIDGLLENIDHLNGGGGGDDIDINEEINGLLDDVDFQNFLINYIQTKKNIIVADPNDGVAVVDNTPIRDIPTLNKLRYLIQTDYTADQINSIDKNFIRITVIYILKLSGVFNANITYKQGKTFVDQLLGFSEIVNIDKKDQMVEHIKLKNGGNNYLGIDAHNHKNLAEFITRLFIFAKLFFYSLRENTPYNKTYVEYKKSNLILKNIKDNKINQALLNLLGLCDYKFFVVKKNKNENFSLDNCVTLKNSSKKNFKKLLDGIKENINVLNNQAQQDQSKDLPVFNFDEEYKKFIDDKDNIFHFDLSIVYKYLFIVNKTYNQENNKTLDSIHFSLSRILKSIKNSQFYTQQSRYVNEFFDNVFTTLETTRYDLKKTIEFSFLTDFSSNRIGNMYTFDELKIVNTQTQLNTSAKDLVKGKKINIGDYFLVSQTGNIRDAIFYTYLYDDHGKPKVLGINPLTGKKEVFNITINNEEYFKNCGVVSRNLQELPSEGKRGVIKLDEYHYKF